MATATKKSRGAQNTAVIDEIVAHARKIADGQHEKITPGMPAAFTAAAVDNDYIRQGDLYLIVKSAVPEGYVLAEKPVMQLVHGQTQGARHCLDSLTGVKMYLPKVWDAETLEGPYILVTKERKILHPTHGPITLIPGVPVQCVYQREWVKEEQKARRAAD